MTRVPLSTTYEPQSSIAPRRSTRERRKVESYYDEAHSAALAALATPISGDDSYEGESPVRQKRRKTESIDGGGKRKQASTSATHYNDDDDSDSESSVSSDNHSQGRSEFTAINKPHVKTRSPKRPVSRKKTEIHLGGNNSKSGAAASKLLTRKAGGGSSRVASTQRLTNSALAHLAKTVLPPEEQTPTINSLVSCVLNSYRPSKGDSSENEINIPIVSPYTRNLYSLSRRIIRLHDEDANKAQILLLNLLFRSVGGCKDTDLPVGRKNQGKDRDEGENTSHDDESTDGERSRVDQQDIDEKILILEDMDTDEWARIVTDLVDDMRHTPATQILLCCDPKGAVHQAYMYNVTNDIGHREEQEKKKGGMLYQIGAVEYRKMYREFWYVLGNVALNEGGMAATVSDESLFNGDDGGKKNGSGAVVRLDAQLLKDLISRITDLAPVGQPDVRAGATLAALSMSYAALDQSALLVKKIDVAKRQYEAARKKGAGAKTEALKVRVESLKRSIQDLEEVVLGSVIQGLFVHRYRDSNEHIRTMCIESLSRFTLQRPDIFLTDKYLKYFGWMMHDKSEHVRFASLMGLLRPFVAVRESAEGKEHSPGDEFLMVDKIDLTSMEVVVAKFLPRIADSVLDVNLEVQEAAMSLMLELLKFGFLDDLDDDRIWTQVNSRSLAPDASPKLRKNALYFVLEQLEPFDVSEEEKDATAADSERKRAQQLDSIASFAAHSLTSGTRPIDKILLHLVDYLVQSLRQMPEYRLLITDWNAMLRSIEDDNHAVTAHNVRASEKASLAKQRVLVRMLACAAKEEVDLVGEKSFLPRDIDGESEDPYNKVKPSGKALKKGREHEILSIALLKALPNLLIQFKGDLAIIPEIASLPRFFTPVIFSLPEMKLDFSSMIKNLGEIYLSSSDDKILYHTALTLVSLSKVDHARVAESKLQLHVIVAALRDRLYVLMSSDDGTVTSSGVSIDPELKKQRFKSSNRRSSRKKPSENSTDSSQTSLTDDAETSAVDTEYSIYLNLKRLRHLSKRCDLSLVFDSGEDGNHLELLCTFICDGLSSRLRACKPVDIRLPNRGDEETSANKLIDSPNMLAAIGKSVQEGLQFVLCTIAWCLLKVQTEQNLIVNNEDLINNEPRDDIEDEEVVDHTVIRLRNHLLSILELCFAQYLPVSPEHDDEITEMKHTPEQINFSDYVQLAAGSILSDLRSLLPKEYADVESPHLRSFALLEDSRLIGAYVRFLGSKEDNLHDNVSLEKENKFLSRSLLLPMGRAIVANWNNGNRREAGMFLRHISSSGSTASSIVSACVKEMRKIDAVRLLESQMTSLRQSYEIWVDDEPELDSDRPTEEEMNEYEEAVKTHREQFIILEQHASHFSQSLGVFGKLSDQRLGPALNGFLREGIRFSFSVTDVNGEEALVLGSRLSFLLLLTKYSTWVKKVKKSKSEIQSYIDELELEMRNHDEFEQVHEDDMNALKIFRQTVGLKTFTELISPTSLNSRKVHCANKGSPDDESMDSITNLHATPSSLVRSIGRPSSTSTRKSLTSLNASSLPTLTEAEQEDSPTVNDEVNTPTAVDNDDEEDSIAHAYPSESEEEEVDEDSLES